MLGKQRIIYYKQCDYYQIIKQRLCICHLISPSVNKPSTIHHPSSLFWLHFSAGALRYEHIYSILASLGWRPVRYGIDLKFFCLYTNTWMVSMICRTSGSINPEGIRVLLPWQTSNTLVFFGFRTQRQLLLLILDWVVFQMCFINKLDWICFSGFGSWRYYPHRNFRRGHIFFGGIVTFCLKNIKKKAGCSARLKWCSQRAITSVRWPQGTQWSGCRRLLTLKTSAWARILSFFYFYLATVRVSCRGRFQLLALHAGCWYSVKGRWATCWQESDIVEQINLKNIESTGQGWGRYDRKNVFLYVQDAILDG